MHPALAPDAQALGDPQLVGCAVDEVSPKLISELLLFAPKASLATKTTHGKRVSGMTVSSLRRSSTARPWSAAALLVLGHRSFREGLNASWRWRPHMPDAFRQLPMSLPHGLQHMHVAP